MGNEDGMGLACGIQIVMGLYEQMSIDGKTSLGMEVGSMMDGGLGCRVGMWVWV